MLDADVFAAVRVGPTCDVAGREDARSARLQESVDKHATVKREAGLSRQTDPRSHTDAGHNEICDYYVSAVESHLPGFYRGCRLLEMENHTMLLVQRAHEVAHLRPENAFHRPLLGRDHMGFDTTLAQGGGDLETNKTRTEYGNPARRLGAPDNRATVGEGTQREDVGRVCAGDRQSNGLSAGGK
jgi:hypothetical protein